MILTDEEISQLWLQQPAGGAGIANCFARAIEAAVLAKFENVAMVKEPFFGVTSNEITKHLPPFTQLYALKEKT
jgi:hypothetical protein